MHKTFIAILLLVSIQTACAESPDAVVVEFQQAIATGDYVKAASLYDTSDADWIGNAILSYIRDNDSSMAKTIYGENLPTDEELASMTSLDAFSGYLKFTFRAIGDAELKLVDTKIIGTVMETDRVAHVVYRNKWDGQTIGLGIVPDLMTVVRPKQKWSLILTPQQKLHYIKLQSDSMLAGPEEDGEPSVATEAAGKRD